MAQRQPARRKSQPSKTPVSIPDKLYFRIGDVASLCSLPAYVLRFWETEFPQLKPNKGGTGQRLYRKRDVEMVLEIKRLLYDEGFTIAGARRLLTEKRRSAGLSLGIQGSGEEREAKRGFAASGARAKAVESKNSAPSKTPAKPLSNRPEIRELRKEMRELLTLLGSDASERKLSTAPAKRDSKKTRQHNEPTLF